MVLLMLLSIFANLGLALVELDQIDEHIESNNLQEGGIESFTNAPISIGNYTEGGRHLVTNEWWQPQGNNVPSTSDYDGDGIANSDDLTPFERNSGSSSSCSSECEVAQPPLLSSAFTPDWVDNSTQYPVDALTAIELADMDNDGDLDMVMGDQDSNDNVWLYISWNVKGVFMDPNDIASDYYNWMGWYDRDVISKIKAVDLDLDGDLDLVVGFTNSVKVIEMENGADIQITTLALTAGNANSWSEISVGDVDGDGYPDILVGSLGGQYYVNSSDDGAILMENDGPSSSLSFTKIWNFSAYRGVSGAILTDWDADGDLDVLIGSGRAVDDTASSLYSKWVYGFESNSGSISSNITFRSLAGGSSSSKVMGLAAGDLNGDSHPELVVSLYDQKTYVLKNRKNSSQPYHSSLVAGTTDGTGLVSVACPTRCGGENPKIIDLNNDGLGDLLIGSTILSTTTESHIYLHDRIGWSNSTPSFSHYKTWDYDGIDDFVVGDITGNSLVDIIYSPTTSPLEIYHSGGATMSASVEGNLSFLNSSTWSGAGTGLVVDFDSDGDDDVIAVDFRGVHVFEQTDAGIATSAEPLISSISTSNNCCDYMLNVQVIDINQDGEQDFVVGSRNGVRVYLRQTNGTYSSPTEILTPNSTVQSTSIEIAAEIGNWGSETGILVELYRFDPAQPGKATVTIDDSGDYTEFWTSLASNSTTGIAVDLQMADMNGDGRKDIVRCMTNEIQIYNSTLNWNNWNLVLNFSTNPWVISNGTEGFCSIADVDGDGYNDILTRSSSNGRIIMGPSYSLSSNLGASNYINHIQAFDIDRDGSLEFIIQRGTGGTGSIVEINTLPITGPEFGAESWTGGGRRNVKETGIGDINGDGLLDLVQFHWMSSPEYILGVSDGDNDAIPDSRDDFPYDPTQKFDTDSDGYGNSNTGMLGDECPYYWGDSTEDRRGCPDQDSDGWSDLNDAFWRESTQWADIDGDGQGDNAAGSNPDPSIFDFDNDGFDDAGLANIGASGPYDSCKYSSGTSDQNNTYGCLDTDGDGWSNIEDKFTGDSTQWNDTDSDGFGDESRGYLPDSCPWTSGTSFVDVFGCIDLDGDGTSYITDYDDNNSDEIRDSDNDGMGDNGDNCPYEWSNLTTGTDRGCRDSDGDGVSNTFDAFPEDSNETKDGDGDGVGDVADSCPKDAGTSWRDLNACEDSDGDGYSNQADLCPNLWGLANAPHIGCPDRDEDGVADQADAFPDDENETGDRDKDGLGDESDQYPDDHDNDGVPTNEDWDDFDSTESMDSDDDSVGDNADVWPDDPDVWSDGDGDGYSDQLGHRLSDDCPSIPGNSTKFQDGCSDLDGDGMPDVLDPDIDGDGITNDNEMDASSGDVEYDPFDAKSRPDDLDGDNTPDILDSDIDGDGFPNEFENERGSSSEDQNSTPFNIYSDSASGVYYVPGEGFKDNYDPDGYELSISLLINMITSEFLIPLLILPLSMFGMLRKGRRYKKVNKQIRNCKGLDNLNKFEPMIDSMIIGKKVKVEHGILLRNLFERLRSQMEDAPQMPIGVGTSRIGGGGGRRGSPPQSRPGTRPGGQAQTRGGPRRPGMQR